jgi:hypothetical protein
MTAVTTRAVIFVGLELDAGWPKVSVWPESISLKKTSPSAGELL